MARNRAEQSTIDITAAGTIVLQDTAGAFANKCTESTVKGNTSVFTGTTVSGTIAAENLTFKKCTTEPVVTHAGGTLSIENICGTTNGTLRSNGAKVTVPSPFGP